MENDKLFFLTDESFGVSETVISCNLTRPDLGVTPPGSLPAGRHGASPPLKLRGGKGGVMISRGGEGGVISRGGQRGVMIPKRG